MIKKRSSWQIQKAVIKALFIRELKTRFSGYRLSYFWLVFEPAIGIIIISIIMGGFRGNGDINNAPAALFIATGFLMFGFFSKITNSSVGAIASNKALFNYRQVKPFDAFLTRFLLELFIFITVFFVLALGAWWFLGYVTWPDKPLEFFAITSVLVFFSFGFGVSVMVFAALHQEAAKFIPVIMRPLFFISGLFFPLISVPSDYHIYLLWNPLLHINELVRVYYFSGYQTTPDISYLFVLFLGVSFGAFGLLYYQVNKLKIIAT